MASPSKKNGTDPAPAGAVTEKIPTIAIIVSQLYLGRSPTAILFFIVGMGCNSRIDPSGDVDM